MWTRQSDTSQTISVNKATFAEYLALQAEHKRFIEKKLKGEFNVSFAFIATSAALGPFLLGPALLVGGQLAVLAALNAFYANDASNKLGDYKEQSLAGYTKLNNIKIDWDHSVGFFSNNIVSIELFVPVMRFKHDVTGQIIHVAAGSGSRLVSATTKSGIKFQS